MSMYGDFQFIQAETEYKLERGRTAPWLASRPKAIRRRMPMRRSAAESIGPRRKRAA